MIDVNLVDGAYYRVVLGKFTLAAFVKNDITRIGGGMEHAWYAYPFLGNKHEGFFQHRRVRLLNKNHVISFLGTFDEVKRSNGHFFGTLDRKLPEKLKGTLSDIEKIQLFDLVKHDSLEIEKAIEQMNYIHRRLIESNILID